MKENSSWGRKLLTLTTSMTLALGATVAVGTSAHAVTHDPMYITFESNDAVGALVEGFSQSEGSVAAIAAAPVGNLNGDSNAFKFEKTGDPWSGMNLLTPSVPTGIALTNAANPIIELDYYSGSSVATPVTLELNTDWKSQVVQEAQPGWNHLTFDFSQNANWVYNFDAGPHTNFTTLALFPNFGASQPNWNNTAIDYAYSGAPATTAGDTYYVDNISINGGTTGDEVTSLAAPRVSTSITMTFEADDARGAAAVGPSSNSHWGGAFDGGGTAIESAIDGGNGGQALKFTKGGPTQDWPCGVCNWSGVNLINVIDDNNIRLTDADHKLITMNYYNPLTVDGPITAKLGSNVTVVRQASPGWSKLTFDMSEDVDWSAATEYTQLALLINWNDVNATHGDNTVERNYYIDNVGINGGTTPEIPLSTNANLSALTLSSGILSPAFGANIIAYTASVASSVSSVNVTATKADSGASLTIKGAAATSGSAKSVALTTGANSIPVVVTAASGATKTYTITVTRAAAVTKATISRAATVTGTAKKAKVLTASATFAGSTSTKTYQWYRCTATASATGTALPTSAAKCSIAKAYSSSASYTVTTTDVGKYMRVVVKATNSAGTTLSLSKTTAKVVK